jgi:hypothetical protein
MHDHKASRVPHASYHRLKEQPRTPFTLNRSQAGACADESLHDHGAWRIRGCSTSYHPMHAAEPASQASCRTHPSRSWWCIRGCTTSPDACSRASQSSLMPHPPIHPSIHSSILSCAGGAGGNRRITCGRCDCGLCVTDGCAGWQHWPQHGSRFGKGQAPFDHAPFSSSLPSPAPHCHSLCTTRYTECS